MGARLQEDRSWKPFFHARGTMFGQLCYTLYPNNIGFGVTILSPYNGESNGKENGK